MCRCIQYFFISFHEKRTGGSPFAGADHLRFVTIAKILRKRHGEYLVAVYAPCFVVRLERDHLAIEAPVCFGVIGAKRKLSDILEVFFFGIAKGILGICRYRYNNKEKGWQFHGAKLRK